MTVTWCFPENNHGLAAGFNDGAMDHFKGQRLSSLVREVVQNSLDAGSGDGPVRMKFFYEEGNREKYPEAGGLAASLKGALKTVEDQNLKQEYGAFFENAIEKTEGNTAAFLCIHDANTSGLTGPIEGPGGSWYALTKGSGLTQHADTNSLGSFGHGSKAPFTMSNVRSVFYYTEIQENGQSEQRFQGKSILQSHMNASNNMTQGTGFYGDDEKLSPLLGREVPEWAPALREKHFGNDAGAGTSIYVAHTSYDEGLYPETAITVIANFYFAIKTGKLEVDVGGKFLMDKEHVEAVYRELRPQLPQEQDEIDADYVEKCFESVDTIIEYDHEGVQEVSGLGTVDWFLRVSDDLPRKRVAVARQNGMLITDKAPNLQQFGGFKNFDLFVCVSGQNASELLKRIENPQHDNFSFYRIDDEEERKTVKREYKRIADKIREVIKRHCSLTAEDTATVFEWDLFKDITVTPKQGENSLERGKSRILSDGQFKFKFPPVTRRAPGEEGPRDEVGGEGRRGGDGRNQDNGGDLPGENENSTVITETTDKKLKNKGKRFVLRDLRVRRLNDGGTKLKLYFNSPVTGEFALQIFQGNETSTGDQLSFVQDGEVAVVSTVTVKEGERAETDVEVSGSASDIALEGVLREII